MASSSSSSLPKSFKYDVFLSFRGEDTRKNFVDHLYHALQQKSVDTFKDDRNMEKGERISTELIKAIEDSRFHIIVFSKNYASSSWCLDELVKIMECEKTTEQKAFPVFYDVEPSQIRKQSGAVGEAFAKHRNEVDAGKWRNALEEAASLTGWELKNIADGHEFPFIQMVVGEISQKLPFVNSSINENLVGMATRIDDIVSSLETSVDDVRMIGIKGIGGGGKTTLARAVFDQISSQFNGKSFVENVREVSKSFFFGLKSLQEQVLSNVLKKDITVNDVHDGKKMMKKIMCGRKVLVVLDDVDHIDQLEALAGKPNWFKSGSRIIITTRDEQLLIAHEVYSIHDVNLLSKEEAVCLFNRFAFRIGEIPTPRFKELSQQVVSYAAGLPLTIRVLGSDLKGKSELEWKDTLERLKIIPFKATLQKLEVSYTSLEDDYKDIFLDVACFWKGRLKDKAIRAFESCKLHAIAGLSVLERKSLITVSKYGFLGMHDSIQEMGWDIVCRDHRDEPERRSRLWDDMEIENILANDLGTGATRCMELTVKLNPNFDMKGLRKMANLRLLYAVSPSDMNCGVDEVSQYFPDALQYLFWQHYPFRCLPNKFRANNLVGLELLSCKMVKLWESGEREVLNKLKSLVITSSTLMTLDLGVTPNLETLYIDKCFSFEELRMRHKHPNLKSLVLRFSSSKSFDLKQTPNLEILSLIECHDLKELHIPNRHPTLKSLELISCSKLRTIDLGRTLNLEMLVLKVCDHLVKLQMPDGHPKLKSLFLKHSKLRYLALGRILNLDSSSVEGCDDLVALHMPLGCPNLQSLQLFCSNLKSLILEMTPNLETLTLEECDKLVHISLRCPKLKSLKHLNPSKLKTIYLKQTVSLETLSLNGCHDLLHISVGCPKLKSLELGPSKLGTLDLRQTMNLEMLSLKGCHDLVKLYMPVGCPKLKSLNLGCSKLRTLDLEGAPNLETLTLEECVDLIEILMPVGCPKLESLEFSYSKVRTLDLRLSTNLERLKLQNCDDLVELFLPVKCPPLKILELSCSKLRTLNLGLTPNLEVLILEGCHDLVEILMPAGCPELESFEFSYSKVRTLDLRLTTNLQRLKLQNCDDLVELFMPVKCPQLKTLELSCSKLRTLNLGLTPNLETLTLEECADLVEILMPAGCPKLESFEFSYSKVRTLDLRLTTNLKRLKLQNCDDLVELSMPVKCPQLKTLDLSCSKLSTLNLGLTPNLEKLILRECDDLVKLCLPVECPKLETLMLTHSKLRILNLRRTPNLRKLDLRACSDLVKLRMSRCLKLKWLELISISKLRTFNLWLTPNLKHLTLWDCCNLVQLHAPPGYLEKMDFIGSLSCPRWNIFKSPGVDSVAELYLIVEPVDVCPFHPDNSLPKFRFRCFPSSVGNLEKLISVGLCACTNLKKFSGSICNLQCLRKLTLKGIIPEVPNDLDRLENLEELSFVYTEIIHLPDSIYMLKHLKSLELEHCWLLEKLPKELDRLEYLEKLILLHCQRLRDIPNSICTMKRLQLLNLTYCIRVKKLPEELGHLVSLKKLWIEVHA